MKLVTLRNAMSRKSEIPKDASQSPRPLVTKLDSN